MIAIALIHLCFGSDSLSELYKSNLVSLFATIALSSKIIQLNMTIIQNNFSDIFINIWF